MLLLTWAILFATSFNSHAEDSGVNLSVPYSMNLIVDFKYCRSSLKKSISEVAALDAIAQEEKGRADNLYERNLICSDNYKIKKTQAEEWKKEYAKCSKALGECDELPWWKIDMKSAGAGILLTLLLIIGL